MKVLQSSIFRAFCAIIIGALLIKYPDNTVTWITMSIGIMFLLSGIISCAAYLSARKHAKEYTIRDAQGRLISGGAPTFPLVGVGSGILGILLTTSPGFFITTLMYILGAILILGALNQYMALLSARRMGSVSWAFWVCPSLVLLTGIYVMFQPMETAGLPMLILGWCSLLYGVTEIINAVKIHNRQREFIKANQTMNDNETITATAIDTDDDDSKE